jgi:hypothetical protein
MTATLALVKNVTFTAVDGVTHHGTYFVRDKIIHVQSHREVATGDLGQTAAVRGASPSRELGLGYFSGRIKGLQH